MMGADDVRPTSREELKALPKKERKRLLLAAVTKVEEKIAWLEEQLVETSAERDELKDNEVPRLVQESQQCREDLRQLQETHDATLTTHATELQWWKSEVEKKALIISQQVEEIERARDELEEMKGQKDKDAASALKQSEVLARCQEDLEKCQQEAEKRKEEFSKQAEEMQITQAANAQINEDAMRLQKELDQCRAEAEEFQALRAETERLRAADVAATLLLSEKEEELQYLAEELGESRHHVARLEYQMKWMVEEAEEAEEDATPTTEVWGFASARWADSSDSEEAEEAEDATPTTEVWGFASARWADSSDSEADSDLELDPGASAMTVDGFCDRPEASSLFEVHWANIPVEAVAFEAKGRFFLGWDGPIEPYQNHQNPSAPRVCSSLHIGDLSGNKSTRNLQTKMVSSHVT